MPFLSSPKIQYTTLKLTGFLEILLKQKKGKNSEEERVFMAISPLAVGFESHILCNYPGSLTHTQRNYAEIAQFTNHTPHSPWP